MLSAMQPNRRVFLRTAGVIAGGAWALRYGPAGLLDAVGAQAPTADAMRAQLGAAPIQTTKLGEQLMMLSGPGGNVVVLHGP
jgi:hypothetical protein